MFMVDREAFHVRKDSTVWEVKEQIARKLDTSAARLRLFHDQREVGGEEDGVSAPWFRTGVPFGATVQVVLVMYEVGTTEGLRRLVFELSWQRAPKSPPHVNGTCFAYDGARTCVARVDFRDDWGCEGAIIHTGPSCAYDPSQRLKVSLDRLPDVHLLAFVLSGSAPRRPLSSLASLAVSLLDATSGQSLAEYQMSPLGPETAAILCLAIRGGGKWRVVQCGQQCGGNFKQYRPIEDAILRIAEPFWGRR